MRTKLKPTSEQSLGVTWMSPKSETGVDPVAVASDNVAGHCLQAAEETEQCNDGVYFLSNTSTRTNSESIVVPLVVVVVEKNSTIVEGFFIRARPNAKLRER